MSAIRERSFATAAAAAAAAAVKCDVISNLEISRKILA